MTNKLDPVTQTIFDLQGSIPHQGGEINFDLLLQETKDYVAKKVLASMNPYYTVGELIEHLQLFGKDKIIHVVGTDAGGQFSKPIHEVAENADKDEVYLHI